MTDSNDAEKQIIEQNRQKLSSKSNRLKQEELQQKRKELIILIFVICVFGSGLYYYLSKFFHKSYDSLDHITKLNATTIEISQLIDNIRQIYTIHNTEGALTEEQLIERGAIPQRLISSSHSKKVIKNMYGGNIVIAPSEPLVSQDKKQASPTFKMSYQGLPKQTCIDLAIMDWGDKLKGLLAVAIGHYDSYSKEDTAFVDIDKKAEKEEVKEFVDKNGRRRVIRPRNRYKTNIAKPGDEFMPTPFKLFNAESGCSCGRSNSCSFALRYSVFAVDPNNKK